MGVLVSLDGRTRRYTYNDDLYRAGSEQHLVQAEHNLRDDGRARAWCRLHFHHAEVGQVANEWASGTRVCQTVAPEHPLECTDGKDGNALEEKRETGLAAGHATVEKTY